MHIDHIYDDGKADREEHPTQALYVHYLRQPKEARARLQVLCVNHNWLKRYQSSEEKRSKKLLYEILHRTIDIPYNVEELCLLTTKDLQFLAERINEMLALFEEMGEERKSGR